jgi:hypothetical protein
MWAPYRAHKHSKFIKKIVSAFQLGTSEIRAGMCPTTLVVGKVSIECNREYESKKHNLAA